MKGCRNFLVMLLLVQGFASFSQEICNNGIDDDGDGLIDLQDPDCQCHFNIKGNLLQNGSFENYKSCPTNYSYTNDLAIVNGWQYANYTSGNVAEYYHNFSCSYDSGEVMLFLPPELPLPDGNAFITIRQYVYSRSGTTDKGIAKVYISQCLKQPLVTQRSYTLSFSGARFQSNDDYNFKFKTQPFTVAIFGHKDCNAVPFGPVNALSNGCPANFDGWILLGKTTLRSKGKWTQGKITFNVPEDINVIAIGPDCTVPEPIIDHLADSTTYLDFYVYDLDDLHLLPTTQFHFQYISTGNEDICQNDTILSVPFYANSSYQWYKDSIAIAGATTNLLHLTAHNAEGHYNVVITNADSCLTSETYTVLENPLQQLSLPADTLLCYNESLLIAPAIDGVSYTLNGDTSSTIAVTGPGVYRITALSSNGCSKNFTVNVRSNNCSVLLPNAFTPNGDELNDVFRIPSGAKINVETFSIYDRWGNKVFETDKRNGGWDGNYKGTKCAPGIYIYFIQGNLNNKETRIKGFVLLIR